jgi:hypothetical protein
MSNRTVHYDDETRTRTWECHRCGNTVSAWGGHDTSCEKCRAQYNGFGQRLRDDWQDNLSVYDENIGDLEGSEIAAITAEAHQ